MTEVVVHFKKPLTPRVTIGSVARKAHISEAYFLANEFTLQQSLSPTVMLHTIG